MSATFKNARRTKISQSELRKIMNDHKGKLQPAKKIDSPLAKYNEAGQLTCILCKSVVRSEAVWQVHLNAKQHRENVELAKKLKEKTNNFSTVPKRSASPLSSLSEVPAKKLKGILKNGKTNEDGDDVDEPDENLAGKSQIPKDFFDNSANNNNVMKAIRKQGVVEKEKMEVEPVPSTASDEPIPEGFFDDPKLDAKARNIEYKDPVEEEWEKFQKEIREADHLSAAIIAEDQEEATTERQLDEIDEQIKNLTKVLTLERKKHEVISCMINKDDIKMEDESPSTDDDEFDEYLDWRAKKSFK